MDFFFGFGEESFGVERFEAGEGVLGEGERTDTREVAEADGDVGELGWGEGKGIGLE